MQALRSTSVTLEEDSKFYEVRVFDKDGKLRKVISPKDLIKIYWEKFELKRLKTSLKIIKMKDFSD